MTAAPFTPEQAAKLAAFDAAPQLPESSPVVRAVLALHRPWGIYDQCDHKHTEEDVDAGRAINVPEVGYTCDDGLMYQVCRECCTGGEDSDWQSEECATSHGHGKGEPICATVEAVAAVLAADPEPREQVVELADWELELAREEWIEWAARRMWADQYPIDHWDSTQPSQRDHYRRLAAAVAGGTQ